MKTIYYRITLHEPTILTQIEGEPNSAVSYDFIPGSVLRGIVISMYGELNLNAKTVKRLFFSNKTRFLNAYPVINDKRSLPVPISWRKAKYGDANTIYDEALSQKQTDEKMSPVRGFVITDNDIAYIYQPKRVLNVHMQRARKNADEQLVYRYDALAPQQTFEAMIYCQDDDVDMLTSLLHNKHAHIGRARSAGYGKVSIHSINKDDTSWITETMPQPKSDMIITLLSDVIVRDANGQYSPTLSAFMDAMKNREMKCELHPEATHQNKNSHDDSVIRTIHAIQTTLIGGFNRKWGLPLPQTPALKRGSVIHLINVDWDNEHFDKIIEGGIGERCNEGFGQIAVNWQAHATLELPENKKSEVSESPDIPEPVFVEKSDDERVWLMLKKGLERLKEGGKKDEQPK